MQEAPKLILSFLVSLLRTATGNARTSNTLANPPVHDFLSLLPEHQAYNTVGGAYSSLAPM